MPAVVKALLARGADVNARENWKGQTALMWAAAGNNAAAVEALIEAGADMQARTKFKPLPLVEPADSAARPSATPTSPSRPGSPRCISRCGPARPMRSRCCSSRARRVRDTLVGWHGRAGAGDRQHALSSWPTVSWSRAPIPTRQGKDGRRCTRSPTHDGRTPASTIPAWSRGTSSTA